jgi:hypothetical protein
MSSSHPSPSETAFSVICSKATPPSVADPQRGRPCYSLTNDPSASLSTVHLPFHGPDRDRPRQSDATRRQSASSDIPRRLTIFIPSHGLSMSIRSRMYSLYLIRLLLSSFCDSGVYLFVVSIWAILKPTLPSSIWAILKATFPKITYIHQHLSDDIPRGNLHTQRSVHDYNALHLASAKSIH